MPQTDRKDTESKDVSRPAQQKEAGPAGDKELRPGENKGG